ncbi:hypothetical protein PMAYCL1PPCAC_13469, partial [Pristionchus mayeri]
GVTKGLRLHDALHVGRPSVLGGHDAAGRVHQSLRDGHLLDLLLEDVLNGLAEVLELDLILLELLLLLLGSGQFESLLGDGHQLLSFVLLQLLHAVLVDRVHHVQHLESSLADALDKGRVGHGLLRLASDIVDLALILLHASDVVLNGSGLLARGRRRVAQ